MTAADLELRPTPLPAFGFRSRSRQPGPACVTWGHGTHLRRSDAGCADSHADRGGACECGWQGEIWERVTSPSAADLSRRRDYVAPNEFANASSEVEDAIHNEWKTHIAPLGGHPRCGSSSTRIQPGRPPAGQNRRSRQGRRSILGGYWPCRGNQPSVRTRTVGRQRLKPGVISHRPGNYVHPSINTARTQHTAAAPNESMPR
jgi:plasmid stabilization system protein ParE